MKTLIPTPDYVLSESYEREKQTLLHNCWQFAGFKRDLLSNNDFITVDINGRSVVIKNFNGELRAFLNVCAHRFARICNEKKGNGFLQCPYHGWAYDKDGVPLAIPNKSDFDTKECDQLKLKSYAVDHCGDFVFVRQSKNGLSLSEYLGEMARVLIDVSQAMGDVVDVNEMGINANWKIVVENTLEAYHVKKVHPNSFYKMGVVKETDYYAGKHSFAEMEIENTLSSNHRLEKAFSTRPMQYEAYKHWYIFPNLTVASAHGTTFSVQKCEPLSADNMRFTSFVFGTRLEGGAGDSSTVKSFYQMVKIFNRQVFEEDRVVCGYVQLGMKDSFEKYGVLCNSEQRVLAFQRAYLDSIKERELA